MLALNLLIVLLLLYGIARARGSGEALGFLLVSGLLSLPVVMVGNSVNASAFPIDVTLLAYLVRFGGSHWRKLALTSRNVIGLWPLAALAIIAGLSGTLNFLFLEPGPWRFYVFTVVKFVQYTVLAFVAATAEIDSVQLKRIGLILVVGITIYHAVHLGQLAGFADLSGFEYFGPRAFEIGEEAFQDRQSWFLTAIRATVAGTASVNLWVLVAAIALSNKSRRFFLLIPCALCAISVVGTASRSDVAGLLASCTVAVLLAPGRSKVRVAAGIVIVAAIALAVVSVIRAEVVDLEEMTSARLGELWDPASRMEGSYRDRTYDRAALPAYLVKAPPELYVGTGPGNFRRLQAAGVTKNAMGHNSYLHWLGELGIAGFGVFLWWCFVVVMYFANGVLSSRRRQPALQLSLLALALFSGRLVAAWGSESIFGTDGMGYYSLYMVGVIYLAVNLLERARHQVPVAERTQVLSRPKGFGPRWAAAGPGRVASTRTLR